MVESYSLLMEAPSRVMRCALLRSRSRIASPKVGSPTRSCQCLTGTWLAFLQAAESSTELELATGEELEAPVAAVVCFEASAEYELRLARIGGGIAPREGVEWMAALTGPGRVRLQAASHPV